MMAVLILAGSYALPLSASASVLIIGVFVAAVLSAMGQWIASAKTKRDTVRKLVAAALVGASVLVVSNGWCDGWLIYVCWL